MGLRLKAATHSAVLKDAHVARVVAVARHHPALLPLAVPLADVIRAAARHLLVKLEWHLVVVVVVAVVVVVVVVVLVVIVIVIVVAHHP